MTREHEDPPRDGELRAAVREAFPEPPVEAVDWEALEERIRSRSAPLLGSMRRGRDGWTVYAARWARAGIPLAAAAVLALALTLPGTPPPRAASPAAASSPSPSAPAAEQMAPPESGSAATPGASFAGTLLSAAGDPALSFLGSPDPAAALLASALEEE